MKKGIVVGILAGLLVSSAGAVAASRYIITSTRQIKPSVRYALRGNRGPRGFRGRRGAEGPGGPAGSAGPPSVPALVDVNSIALTLQPGQTTYDVDPGWQATCPAGDYVYGTGFNAGGVASATLVEAYGTFVGGFMVNNSSVSVSVTIEAVCGKASGSTGPNARRAVSGAEQRYRSDLSQARTQTAR